MRTAIVALIALLSGCATILQAGPDKIPVRSEPEGAKVYLNDMPVGVTPMIVAVDRKDDCHIDIKKEGFETISFDRDKVVAGWTFGNFALGCILCFGVDLITHNQGKHSEDPVFFNLIPKGPMPASLPTGTDPSPLPQSRDP